ncbi:unnamed protein product [Prunus armeniaca]
MEQMVKPNKTYLMFANNFQATSNQTVYKDRHPRTMKKVEGGEPTSGKPPTFFPEVYGYFQGERIKRFDGTKFRELVAIASQEVSLAQVTIELRCKASNTLS